jgi:hypothetical protein
MKLIPLRLQLKVLSRNVLHRSHNAPSTNGYDSLLQLFSRHFLQSRLQDEVHDLSMIFIDTVEVVGTLA